MMPQLQAQERLARINDAAAGAGNMRPFERQRFVGALERQARGTRRQRAAKATPAALAAMGIGHSTAPETPLKPGSEADKASPDMAGNTDG